MEKTNVMRILDQKKIAYTPFDYSATNALSGVEVAEVLGQNKEQVFKTIVTVSASKKYYVFMLPVHKELDFKKCAAAVNEKSISMLKSADLLPLTGYVHGGCSPIGMKKPFKTTIDISAQNFDSIIFSAGKIGFQVQVSLENLKKVVPFALSSITFDK